MWLWLVLGCQEPAPPGVALPAHYPPPVIPTDNPLTAEKVSLGRYLFYDVRLSINGKRSCGICHEQAIGFTDGFVQAVGATGEKHTRNTLSLLDVAWRSALTWRDPDLRHLEEQLLTPLMGTEPLELGMSEALLIERLSETELYPPLFSAAFPDDAEPLTLDNVGRALASFQRTIYSGDTPYDRYLLGEPDALSAAEAQGMALFFGDRLKCSRCHGGLFLDQPTDGSAPYANTGLYDIDGAGGYPPDETGLHALTGAPSDMGRFRIPSLRGVTTSGPWTHDGTVLSLSSLIEAYARGGRLIESGPFPGDGAQNPHKSPLVSGFSLSPAEQDDLLAFLGALSDTTALTRDDLATPFCVEGDTGAVLNHPCEPPAIMDE